jgi:PAS domain S-box-containing protein
VNKRLFGSLSIRWKIQIAILMSTLVALCILILMVLILQRRTSIRNAHDKLYLLQDTKSRHTEDYFNNLANRIRTFSTDRMTLDIFKALSESFLGITDDNYVTPGVDSYSKASKLLEGFYNNEVLPVIEERTKESPKLQAFLPPDTLQQIMQYLYLAGNTKPFGLKHSINEASDASTYSLMHSQYHQVLLNYARKAGLSDILLIDYRSGYVFYSVKKNLDFATNLYDGPYKNSALAKVFKTVVGMPEGSVKFTDETLYIPALLKPEIFVSSPVFSGSQLMGAVVFSLNAQVIDNLLKVEREELTNDKSLKAFIVGEDLLYRNNDPDFIESPARYIRKLKRNSRNGETFSATAGLNTNVLIQGVDPEAFADALNGKSKLTAYVAETGEKVLCSYGPLNIEDLNWTLVAQMNKAEILAPANRLLWILAGIALLVCVILYYFAHRFSKAFTGRLTSLQQLVSSLVKGKTTESINKGSDDEIGQSVEALNQLTKRISEASAFATEMGRGNMNIGFDAFGNEDQLGISLNNLKDSLLQQKEAEDKRKHDDEIRNWTTQGIAMFNEILRKDNDDLKKLALNIVRNSIEYLSANQGGLFLIENDGDEDYLNLIASYAYNRQKFLKKRIGIGEGLTGTCVLEKKTVLLDKIPDDYIEITSGLGGAKPGCLMIVPLKKDEEILGVLEIASFSQFRPYEVEFVEKVAESIASALITVRLHLQTSQYLERFQQQAEEMKAQDEELRQNLEELQATQEQMERLKQEDAARNEKMLKELEDYRKLLIDILDKVPGKIFLKDENGTFIVVNSAVAAVYNKSAEQIIGTSDYDNHPDEDVDSWRAQELEIVKKGESATYLHEEKFQGKIRYLNTIKMPFKLATTGKTGLLGIQFDITEVRMLKNEIAALNKEIEELRREQVRSKK